MPQQGNKSRKGNGMKISANIRRGQYKRRPQIVAKRKDQNVFKSSHGKFRSVAELVAAAKRETK